jgi:hypothetical protein
MTPSFAKQPLLLACTATALLALMVPRRALGTPTKDQCVDANTQAQDLRRENHLLNAREALRLCAQESCPRIVRKDCIQRLDEIEAAVPNIAFEVKDGAGRDLSDVTVTMDDKPLLDHLDGTPVEVDPGDHSFSFSAPGLTAKTLELVVRQGDRGRREAVTLVSPSESAAAKAQAKPADQPPNTEAQAAGTASSGRKVLAWTAIGIGAAGVVLGGVTAALAISKKNMIDGAYDCQQNHCDPRERPLVNDYNHFRTVSSIGFIAGGVFAATGVVLLLTAPRSSEPRAALWVGLGSLGFIGKFQ